MKPNFPWIFIPILVAGAIVGCKDATSTGLADKYKNAKTELEKLLVCIEAIDAEEVRYFGPVSKVDEVFGTDLADRLPAKEDSPRRETIYFGTVHEGPPNVQHSREGWRLCVEYSNSGAILFFYLTNIDKDGPRNR